MIPVGTKVRLRTTNGGDLEAFVDYADYRPTFSAWFVHVGPDGAPTGRRFVVSADRIRDVVALP